MLRMVSAARQALLDLLTRDGGPKPSDPVQFTKDEKNGQIS